MGMLKHNGNINASNIHDFPVIWVAVPRESTVVHFEGLLLPNKIFFVTRQVNNVLFENNSPPKSLWSQFVIGLGSTIKRIINE